MRLQNIQDEGLEEHTLVRAHILDVYDDCTVCIQHALRCQTYMQQWLKIEIGVDRQA